MIKVKQNVRKIWFLGRKSRYNTLLKYLFFIVLVVEIFFIFPKLLQFSIFSFKSNIFHKENDHFKYMLNETMDLKLLLRPDEVTVKLEPRKMPMEPIYLLVMICSATQHFRARSTIRSTWANMNRFNYSNYVLSVLQNNLHEYMLMEPAPPPDNFKAYSVNKYYKYLYKHTAWKKRPFIRRRNNSTFNIKNHTVTVKVLFMLGIPDKNPELQHLILREHKKYNDIIQEDFIDSYKNLSVKTGMMLKWVSSNTKYNISFIIKCDDDVYLNIYKLIYKLKHMKNQTKLLMGKVFVNGKVTTNTKSKYYSRNYASNFLYYPKYLSGPAYLMSLDAAVDIYETALNTPILNVEDVFYTGICAKSANISHLNSVVFLTKNDTLMYCKFSYYIGSHTLTPRNIWDISRRCDVHNI